jgi:hypothetical protein
MMEQETKVISVQDKTVEQTNEEEYELQSEEEMVEEVPEEEDEYETIDVTDNPLYQVLSVFFENEEGKNLVDVISDLKLSVDKNNELLNRLLLKKRKPREA